MVSLSLGIDLVRWNVHRDPSYSNVSVTNSPETAQVDLEAVSSDSLSLRLTGLCACFFIALPSFIAMLAPLLGFRLSTGASAIRSSKRNLELRACHRLSVNYYLIKRALTPVEEGKSKCPINQLGQVPCKVALSVTSPR